MSSSLRLAVLIDAENVSHKMAGQVFDLIAPLGEPRVRRLNGDFAGQAGGWADAARRHALEARHCFAPAKGKNGADIELAIDAIRVLHTGGIDAFCIVSSDGDFAGVARTIREAGQQAFGIGRATTTRGYRLSCTRFFCLDPEVAIAKAPHAALPLIREVLDRCSKRNGWYHLGAFGIEARKAGLEPKDHGASGLGKLMHATGQFTFNGTEWFQPTTLRAVGSSQ